jgi:hypothetical protein
MSTGEVDPYTEALVQIHDNTGCGQCETTVDGAHECSDEVYNEPLTFPAYRNEKGYGPGYDLHHCYNESTVKETIKTKAAKREIPTDPHTRAQWKLPSELIPAEETDDGDDGDDYISIAGSDNDSYESVDHVDGADLNTIRQMMEGVVISSSVFNIYDIMELMNTGHDFMARNLFDITIDFPMNDVHGESYQGFKCTSLEVLVSYGMHAQAKRYFYRTLASTTKYSVKDILYLHSVGLNNEARRLFGETLSCADTFDVDAITQLYQVSPSFAYTTFRETLKYTDSIRYGGGFDPVPVVQLKKCGMVEQAIELFDTTSRIPSVLPNGHTPMYLHAIILKTGGMGRQASDLFRVMYSLDHRRVTSEWFYEDLSTALKEVFMDNEANQVINGYRGGTTQRNLADEFDDADDHM